MSTEETFCAKCTSLPIFQQALRSLERRRLENANQQFSDRVEFRDRILSIAETLRSQLERFLVKLHEQKAEISEYAEGERSECDNLIDLEKARLLRLQHSAEQDRAERGHFQDILEDIRRKLDAHGPAEPVDPTPHLCETCRAKWAKLESHEGLHREVIVPALAKGERAGLVTFWRDEIFKWDREVLQCRKALHDREHALGACETEDLARVAREKQLLSIRHDHAEAVKNELALQGFMPDEID